MKKSIRVFAPASVGNVICGFDVLGLAIDQPGDEVELHLEDTPGVVLETITGDGGLLPTNPKKNTASAVIADFLEQTGNAHLGISVSLHKKMPIGSGLGSSAASTAAGLFAINEMLDRPLSRLELLPFAQRGEELACGSGHLDNVAPALLGGLVLIKSYDPVEIIRLPVPEALTCTVVHPHIEIETRMAREILPEQISLKKAVAHSGNLAGFISGLYTTDYELISRSLKDLLAEPHRSKLIPGFDPMKKLALASGALGFGISGAGPSVFAMSRSRETARRIEGQLYEYLQSLGISSDTYVSKINTRGPKTL